MARASAKQHDITEELDHLQAALRLHRSRMLEEAAMTKPVHLSGCHLTTADFAVFEDQWQSTHCSHERCWQLLREYIVAPDPLSRMRF